METQLNEERVPSLGRVLGKRALIYVGLLALVFVLLLIANSSNASAATPISSSITTNTTWNLAGSPYVIQNSIAVTGTGVTLTIDPGVSVQFNGFYSITVQDGAKMVAIGDSSLGGDGPVTFTSNLGSPAAGDWNGLVFASTQSGSVLNDCFIQYADNAVSVTDTTVTLTGLSVYTSGGNAFTFTYTTGPRTLTLSHILILDADNYGIAVTSTENITLNLNSPVDIFSALVGGVYVTSSNNATVSLTGVGISAPGVGSALGVFAGANYAATINMHDSTVFDAQIGVYALGLAGDATVNVDGSSLGNVVGVGSTYAVAAISDAPDTVSVVVTGTNIENVTTGVYAAAVGDVSLTVDDCYFNIVTVNAITMFSSGGACDLTLDSTSFNDSISMVAVQAYDGVSADVSNVKITNSTNGFDFWSAFGPVDVTMTQVVADSFGNGVVLGNPSDPLMDGTATLTMTNCNLNGGFMIGAFGIEVNANSTVTITFDNVTFAGFGDGLRASSQSSNVIVNIQDSELDSSYASQISLTAVNGGVSLVLDGVGMQAPAEIYTVPAIIVNSNLSTVVELTDVLINHTASGLDIVSAAGDVDLDMTNVTIVADSPMAPPFFVNFGVAVSAVAGAADVDINGLDIILAQDLYMLNATSGDDGISVIANGLVDFNAANVSLQNGYRGLLLMSNSGDVEAIIAGYIGINTAEQAIGIYAAGDVILELSDVYVNSFAREMQTFNSYSLIVEAGGTIDASVQNFEAYAVLLGWYISGTGNVTLNATGVELSSSTNATYWNRMFSGIQVFSDEGAVDASFTDVSLWMIQDWFSYEEWAIDIAANNTVNLNIENAFIQVWTEGVYVHTNLGDVVATVDNLVVNTTYNLGFAIYAPAGAVNVTMTSSSIDNTFGASAFLAQCGGDLGVDMTGVEMLVSEGYGMNMLSTDGNISLTLTDVNIGMTGNDGVRGVATNGAIAAVIDPSDFESIDGYGVYLDSAASLEFSLVNSVINNTVTGVRLIATYGLLDISIEGSTISNCTDWALQGEIDLNDIDFDMTGSTIMNTGSGIDLVTLAGAQDVAVDNSAFDANGYGLFVQGTGADDVVTVTSTTVNDSTYGVAVATIRGNQTITLTDVTVTNCTTGVDAETDVGNITMTVDPSLFENCLVAIRIDSGGSLNLSLTDTTFRDCTTGLQLEAAIEPMTVNYNNVTFDGIGAFGTIVELLQGNLTVVVDNVHMNNTYIGMYLTTDNGTINLNVTDTTYMTGRAGFWVISSNDANVNFLRVTILANSGQGLFVLAGGNSNLNIVDSVFNGADAANAETFVPTVTDTPYAIVNPDSYVLPYYNDYMIANLPFEFAFNGGEYDQMLMSSFGWISPDLSLNPDALYDISGGYNLIAPAPNYWYSDQFAGIGYKVNDSRGAYPENVVFQWYVWADPSQNSLKNVFEVFIYPNGDIEFRYAMMNGNGVGNEAMDYGYGVGFNSGMSWDLTLIQPDFTQFAEMSVYFSSEFLSAGGGLASFARWNTTATITDTLFSNYVRNGAALISLEGWMTVDVTDSTFSHIYSDGTGALRVQALNNTMELTVEGCDFNYLYSIGVYAIDDTTGNSSSSMVVTDNTFYEVIMTYDLVSNVAQGVEDNVTFDGVKTFSDNVGEHVGIGFMGTYAQPLKGNWTITETDTMSNNNLTGLVSIWLQMIGGPGSGSMLASYFEVDNVGAMTVDATYIATASDNVLTDPGLFYPFASTSGIEIEAYVDSTGPCAATFSANVVADDNLINTTQKEFNNGIYIDIGATVSNTDLLMTTFVDTSGNTLTSDYGYFNDAIYAESYINADEGTGSDALFATFTASDNLVLWADEGIYFEAGIDTYNQRGAATATVKMTVDDNEIGYCDYGIGEDVWTNVQFNTYFPPYEEVANATGVLLFDCQVTDNNVYGSYDVGIYVRADAEALGDMYGVFSHATVSSMGSFTITDNQMISGDAGIKADLYTVSRADTSDAVSDYTVWIVNNSVVGGIDINSYTYTLTEWLRYFDTMTATTNLIVNIDQAVLAEDGVYVDQYVANGAEGYAGSGVATLNSKIDIHNLTTDPSYGINNDGAYVYTELGNDFGYGGGRPTAIANVTASITKNVLNGGAEWGDTGIGFNVVRHDGYTEVFGAATIANNVITDMDTGIYAGGQVHQFEDNIPVTIDNNTMNATNTGIETYDAMFDIDNCQITNSNDDAILVEAGTGSINDVLIDNAYGDGVDVSALGSPTGYYYYVTFDLTLTNSVIRNVSYDAIHVSEVNDMTIWNNEISNVGDDGVNVVSSAYSSEESSSQTWDINITDNSFTTIGNVAIVLYGVNGDSEDINVIADNTITGASEGIWIGYTSFVDITGDVINVVGTSGIVLENVYKVQIDMCTLTGPAVSGLMVDAIAGVYVSDSESVLVESTSILGFENGVIIYDSDSVTLEMISVIGSVEDGVQVSGSDDIQIGNSTISGSGMDGVDIGGCDGVLLINNEISNNGYNGLLLTECGDVMLINGDFVDNGNWGILATGTTVDWIINETATVTSNDVEFGGDVTVQDGGVLRVTDVYWYVDNDDVDGLSTILVQSGGTMYLTDSTVENNAKDVYAFNVYGTLEMTDSVESGAIELLLGAGSNAYIESSTISYNDMNGIHIVDCSPEILTSTIVANGRNGILIEGGEAAAPSITDCMILGNERGISAMGGSLEGVTGNLFVLNYEAGIYCEGVTGSIHDNTLVLDGKEIYVKDSNVSIMNNQIGYTRLVQVLAQLLPLLGGNLNGSSLFGFVLPDLDTVINLIAHHTGLYMVNSQVTASGNTYGLLTTAVILTQGSKLTFSDTIRQDVLLVPYMGVDSVIRNISVPIPVYDGIVAIDSSVSMNGASINVLDDALFLDNSTATVSNSNLTALDFGIYAIHGSTANVIASTFGRAVAEDTSVISVSSMLTVVVKDPWGATLAGVPVNVTSAAHVSVSGVTDSNGVFASIVAAYTITASGSDMTVEPYSVKVNFTGVPTTSYPGFNDTWNPLVVSKMVTVSGATTVTVQTSLVVKYALKTVTQDPMGNMVSGATVVYTNAMGTAVASGTTVSGVFSANVVAYVENPTGPDSSMNPYAVSVVFPATGTGYAGTAVFMPANVTTSVNVDQQTKTVTVKTGLWMYFDMTIITRDKNNNTAAGIMVTVYDGSGALIRQAPTDANGTMKLSVVGWKMSADGVKDTSVDPYQVLAGFGSGVVKGSVDMANGPVVATLKEGAPPTSWGAAAVMGIAAAFITGGSLLLIARKP